MPHTATTPQQGNLHTRFVEYVDVFSHENVAPMAAIKDNLLLFDTFQGNNPLQFLYYKDSNKMYQKLAIYVTEGEAIMEINGKEEKLTAPSLVTILPENITRITHTTDDFGYFMLVVYPRLATQTYNDIGITYSNARMSLRHFNSPLSPEQMERMRGLYLALKKDILGPDYEFKDAYLHALMAAITVENINIHKYNPIPLQGNSNSRQYDVFCRFLSLLNKHSVEHRTVLHYAQTLGISSKYLSFVCISYSKKNASTWIDESVVQKAKALILVHHYSFSEASEILHFPTVSSFSRFFKRVTGMTPKAYIQSQTPIND